MNKSKKTRQEKGITLIALIITIIVLLILAVVAIRAVQGEGIVAHAKNARAEYAQKAEEENTTLEEYISKIESNIPNGDGAGTVSVAYTTGQIVMVGTEKFYVMADSDETQDKITLLAFECIDTENLVQSASANTIAFSETNYWASDFTSSPYDLIETGAPDASHYAAKAAYDYGAKLGGIGRLMTFNEGTSLTSKYGPMIYGTAKGGLVYWLRTSYDGDEWVCIILGDMDGWETRKCTNDEDCCVRPVVEISKSKVSLVS